MFNFYLDMWAAWKIGGWVGRLLSPLAAVAILWFFAPVILVYFAAGPVLSFFKRHVHSQQSFS